MYFQLSTCLLTKEFIPCINLFTNILFLNFLIFLSLIYFSVILQGFIFEHDKLFTSQGVCQLNRSWVAVSDTSHTRWQLEYNDNWSCSALMKYCSFLLAVTFQISCLNEFAFIYLITCLFISLLFHSIIFFFTGIYLQTWLRLYLMTYFST